MLQGVMSKFQRWLFLLQGFALGKGVAVEVEVEVKPESRVHSPLWPKSRPFLPGVNSSFSSLHIVHNFPIFDCDPNPVTCVFLPQRCYVSPPATIFNVGCLKTHPLASQCSMLEVSVLCPEFPSSSSL